MKRLAYVLAAFPALFIALFTPAHAAVGPVVMAAPSVLPVLAFGGLAWLASGLGPRIAFEKPNEGGFDGEALAKQVKDIFAKEQDKVREIAEKALAEAGAGKKLTTDFKEKADEALNALGEKVTEAVARLGDVEQKMARRPGNDDVPRSYGQQFVETDEFKSLRDAPRSGASAVLRIKADLTTSTADAAGAVGAAIVPNRRPGVLPLPQRRMTVRDLITPGQTDSPIIQYVRETGFTNAAAMVAEGAAKPGSDIKLADVDVTTKVIAHWFRVTRQTLSDVAQVRSLIDQRLLYGLALKEEDQLLNGDGTGENLAGIVPQATAYSAPITLGSETSIDKLRLAMLQAVLAEYPATAHVMNPIDWAWVETLKDTTGRYIIGNPQGSITPTLWNLPVVETQAMAVDKFLTGAFQMGAQIFDQWASRIEVGFQNDDFTKNKVTILGEERLALAVYRPEAFIYGDFGRVA